MVTTQDGTVVMAVAMDAYEYQEVDTDNSNDYFFISANKSVQVSHRYNPYVQLFR